MSDLVKDLKTLLVAQGIVPAANIFCNYRPEAPDQIISIYDTGGFPSTQGIEDVRRTVQFLSRNKDGAAARATSWQMFNLLDNKYTSLNGRNMHSQAMQPPFIFARDNQERLTYAFNLWLWTQRD